MTLDTYTQKQWSYLITAITAMWDGASATSKLQALFEKGVKDGQFWLSDEVLLRIGENMHPENQLCYPLDNRSGKTSQGESYRIYDALCLFNNWIQDVKKVKNAVTGSGNWSFVKSYQSILNNDLKDSAMLSQIKPKSLPITEQNIIAAEFKGVSGSEVRSDPTIIRLSPYRVKYFQDNQGMSPLESLYSAIYSHGLACAEQYNTEKFIADIQPIYERYANTPFNVNNGEELMMQARKNVFVKILEETSPPRFSNNQEIQESLKYAELLALESPEQKELREKEQLAIMKSSIAEMDFDQMDAEYELEMEQLRNYLNTKFDLM